MQFSCGTPLKLKMDICIYRYLCLTSWVHSILINQHFSDFNMSTLSCKVHYIAISLQVRTSDKYDELIPTYIHNYLPIWVLMKDAIILHSLHALKSLNPDNKAQYYHSDCLVSSSFSTIRTNLQWQFQCWATMHYIESVYIHKFTL